MCDDEAIARSLQQQEDANGLAALAAAQQGQLLQMQPQAQWAQPQLPPQGQASNTIVYAQPMGTMPANGFCESSCLTSSCGLVVGYILVTAVGAFATQLLLDVGIFVISLGPPTFVVVFFLWGVYPREAQPKQALFSCLEAIGLMLPLLLVVLPAGLAIGEITGVDREDMDSDTGATPEAMLATFIISFVLAAIPEEILKLLTVWRLVGVTPDPRGLLVYAMCGAAGFAAVENFLYVATSSALGTGLIRAALSVPGHITTGAIIGGRLARDVYLGDDPPAPTQCAPSPAYALRILWVPILLHGSFNFLLYTTLQFDNDAWSNGVVAAVAFVDLVGITIARHHARHLSQYPPQDAAAAVAAGSAPPPELRCCLGVCGGCCRSPAPGPQTVAMQGPGAAGPGAVVIGSAVGQPVAVAHPMWPAAGGAQPIVGQPVFATSGGAPTGQPGFR